MSTIFQTIDALIPEKGSVRMTITKAGDGRITVAVLPVLPEQDATLTIPGKDQYATKQTHQVNIVPLSLTGTALEVDEGIAAALTEYKGGVEAFLTNVGTMRDKFEAELAAIKAKADAKKKSPVKAKCAMGGEDDGEDGGEDAESRKGGEVDEDQIKALATVPSSDTNFKSALTAANEATLRAALDGKAGLTAKRCIAAELKKITGEGLDALLVPALTKDYKASPDEKDRARFGKALTDLTGKTLEALGLVAVQSSLLAGLTATPAASSTTTETPALA